MEGSKREIERSSLMNAGRRVDYAVRALSYKGHLISLHG